MAAKPDAVDTARRFVGRRHPTAKAAFLGGSVMRGEGTWTSDLDLVIVDNSPPGRPSTSRCDDSVRAGGRGATGPATDGPGSVGAAAVNGGTQGNGKARAQ